MIKSNLDVVRIAREYIGTPICWQARQKGVGIDCVGLIVCIAKEMDIHLDDYAEYRPTNAGLLNRMKEQFIETDELVPGTILVMCAKLRVRRAQHLAIYTCKKLLHAHVSAKRIVEHGFLSPYPERVVAMFRYPGVNYG